MKATIGLLVALLAFSTAPATCDEKKPDGATLMTTVDAIRTHVLFIVEEYEADAETANKVWNGKTVAFTASPGKVDELAGGRLLVRLYVVGGAPNQTVNCYVEKEDVAEFLKVYGDGKVEGVIVVGTVGKPTKTSLVFEKCRVIFSGDRKTLIDYLERVDKAKKEKK